jgi:hypothetical protein
MVAFGREYFFILKGNEFCFEVILSTVGEQNNGNIKKLRNRICIGYIERTSVGNNECSLFTLGSAHVSALVIALSDSPCQRIGKWETVQF